MVTFPEKLLSRSGTVVELAIVTNRKRTQKPGQFGVIILVSSKHGYGQLKVMIVVNSKPSLWSVCRF